MQKSDDVFTSNARWSKIGTSQDKHYSLEMARGVRDSLMANYGPTQQPCETRGTCLEAWVEDNKGKRIK